MGGIRRQGKPHIDSVYLTDIEVPEEFRSKEMQWVYLFCFWMIYYVLKDAFSEERILKNKYISKEISSSRESAISFMMEKGAFDLMCGVINLDPNSIRRKLGREAA